MLEEKLKETTLIFFELEYLKSDLLSINNKESVYFKSIIEKSNSFFRIYQNSYKLFVIELAKIVDSKEHFSLIKLIDFLITNRKKIEWKNSEMKIERLNFIKNDLRSIEELHLEKIKDLRDKYYAHTDKDRHKLELTFSLNIGLEILEKLRGYFEEIILKVNNQKIIFSLIQSEITNDIVLLHRYKLIKELILEKLMENPNIGDLQLVRNIMLKR